MWLWSCAACALLQVEFRYLSKITGIRKYADKVNKVFDHMYGLPSKDGLYPIFVNPSNGQTVGSQVSHSIGFWFSVNYWVGKDCYFYRVLIDLAAAVFFC